MSEHVRKRARRLTKEARHRQLLDTALRIVREEGADRLTLGHLAARAGVSKPVTYEHFVTRSGLLIDLYRWIDTERVAAFRQAMAEGGHNRRETIAALSAAYMSCAADAGDEFNAVGAALAGSDEKATVYNELLDNVVEMFDAVLAPSTDLPDDRRKRTCVALVGAGEALAASVVRGAYSLDEATETLSNLIDASI